MPIPTSVEIETILKERLSTLKTTLIEYRNICSSVHLFIGSAKRGSAVISEIFAKVKLTLGFKLTAGFNITTRLQFDFGAGFVKFIDHWVSSSALRPLTAFDLVHSFSHIRNFTYRT